MCEYLRIPHTGSSVIAEAICHHKPQTKMILMAHGVPTAPFQVFRDANEPLKPELRFPLIVKLSSEGASMGLDYGSVVHNAVDLRERVAYLISAYQQNALVETFIDGREFTVAVLGNNPAYALPVAEILFFGKVPIRLDEPDKTFRVSGAQALEPGVILRRHVAHLALAGNGRDPVSITCADVGHVHAQNPEQLVVFRCSEFCEGVN